MLLMCTIWEYLVTWNLCEQFFVFLILVQMYLKQYLKTFQKYLKQHVLMSCVLLISLDQNVSNYIRTCWYRKLYMKTCCNSKSLWVLTIFLVWLFELKMFRYPQTIIICPSGQNVSTPPNCILLQDFKLWYTCLFKRTYISCLAILHHI